MNTWSLGVAFRSLRVACCILALFCPRIANAIDSDEPYAWPLALPRVVTGTFGEYRGGRFHAGMDLMTGENGRPVSAPADGSLMRVTCSPWGYGRALYLKLDDGNIVVFGHLSRFAPAIADYVHSEQHTRECYAVELEPTPGQFPVRKGDVVAFSGDTGTVDPHLHYEIRNARNQPINPRLCGVQWPDTTPPNIHAVLVAPGEPTALVNGDCVPVVLKARRNEKGEYSCDTVKASGRIVFALDTIDPANNGKNKLGVYRLQTTADGTELFKIQFDEFSYENRQNELVAYYPFVMNEGAFLLQWRWPGNVCDIFQCTKGDGGFDMPEHPVDVMMESVDTNGNNALVRFRVEPLPFAEPAAPALGNSGAGKVDIACVNTWLVVTATFTEPEPELPSIAVEGALGGPGLRFRRIDAKRFRVSVAPAKGVHELGIHVEHPRVPTFEQRIQVFERGDPERTFSVGETAITVKPNSPYGTLYLRAFPSKEFGAPPLPLCSDAFRLWPVTMPVDQALTLTLPIRPGIEKSSRLSVYHDAGSHWTRDGEPAATRVDTRTFGVYALMDDNKAPTLGTIQVAGTGNRPSIRCEVHDVGSGIANWRLTCNERWLLSVYDPARNTIAWEQDEDLPEGPRAFSLEAIDKAGNRTSISSQPSARKASAPAATPAPKRPGSRKGQGHKNTAH